MVAGERHWGWRGAALALGMAGVAGLVLGVFLATEPALVLRLPLWCAALVVIGLAGISSARESLAAALATATAMLAAFGVALLAAQRVMGNLPAELSPAGLVVIAIAAVITCLIGQQSQR
ncbi:MAG: hypothetical protein AAF713_12455 [Pseudomonadota bacterium]